MILDPYRWPHLLLPLKRYVDGFMQTAIMAAGMEKLDPNKPIEIRNNTTIFGPVGQPEILTYENVDALLDDGWEVD
jgi:hypothetical protein